MNTQNLTPEEVKVLHALLGKMIEQPKPKMYFDPVNQMIDDIMDNFDFIKVQNAMFALDWKWASSKNYIPSMDELRTETERLLRDAADIRLNMCIGEPWGTPISCSTGGFKATAHCNEDKTKITRLDLDFILNYWTSRID
jgi:hypothetical protein